jgi:hypothetical protein
MLMSHFDPKRLVRDAARELLLRRYRRMDQQEIVIGRPTSRYETPVAFDWVEDQGVLTRTVCILEGMTVEEGLRVIGGYRADELAEIAAKSPKKMQCGTVVVMRRVAEWAGGS